MYRSSIHTSIQVYLSSACYAQGPVNGSKTAYAVYRCPQGTCNLGKKARIKNTIVQENICWSSGADKKAEEEETNDSNMNRAGRLELKGCD